MDLHELIDRAVGKKGVFRNPFVVDAQDTIQHAEEWNSMISHASMDFSNDFKMILRYE